MAPPSTRTSRSHKDKAVAVIDVANVSPKPHDISTSAPKQSSVIEKVKEEEMNDTNKTNDESTTDSASEASLAGKEVMLVSCDRLSEPSSPSQEKSKVQQGSGYISRSDQADLEKSSVKMADVTNTSKEKQTDCKAITSEQHPSTPVSKRQRYQTLPSSSDSTQDDMTLAEMMSVVLDRRSSMAKSLSSSAAAPANRSLSLAFDASSSAFNTENIDPQRQTAAGGGGGPTLAGVIAPSTLRRCVPLSTTCSECSSSLEEAEKIALPDLASLANFPQYRGVKSDNDGKRNCVMCGNFRPSFKKRTDNNGLAPFILLANRGVCTLCEAAAWNVVESNVAIKFCQQCHCFSPLAFFATKGNRSKSSALVNTCIHCRDHKGERARKRKAEKNARRLEEKSASESVGNVASNMEVESAPVHGKRLTNEASSVDVSSKRSKSEESAGVEVSNAEKAQPLLRLGTERSGQSSPPSALPSQATATAEPPLAQPQESATDEVTKKGQLAGKEEQKVAVESSTPSSVSGSDGATTASPIVSTTTSRNRCIPLSTVKSCDESDMVVVPAFPRLTNFSHRSAEMNGQKQCVMCGSYRLVKKRNERGGTEAIIPFGNKGVCTDCESIPWQVVKTKATIKWCHQGVHFRPLSTFVEKRKDGAKPKLKKSCLACRDLAVGYK